MPQDKIRITFACSSDLRDKLTQRATEEGIPRSQLIVELLETELGDPSEGKSRDAAVNRLIYDIQERVGAIEAWKRQFAEMTKSQQENTENLEETVAYLMNENIQAGGKDMDTSSRKKKIPSPK